MLIACLCSRLPWYVMCILGWVCCDFGFSTEDEQLRALMGEQKALAVDLYGKLQVGFWVCLLTSTVDDRGLCAWGLVAP
jgi:hypothetical protein